jgi:hypothetical protein
VDLFEPTRLHTNFKIMELTFLHTQVNLFELEGLETTARSICDYLGHFDHYWVKSNWEWIIDR